MNKLEQVSSDGHRMSLAEGRGSLYSEVECIMGNGHMGPPPGQIDTTRRR